MNSNTRFFRLRTRIQRPTTLRRYERIPKRAQHGQQFKWTAEIGNLHSVENSFFGMPKFDTFTKIPIPLFIPQTSTKK